MGFARLVVLASGNGSNFQAIVDATTTGTLAAEVSALVTDRVSAPVIERARRAGVVIEVVEREPDEDRAHYDVRLADIVASHIPDVVVLAGWMRVLTMQFLGRFPDRVVNLHPALPGELPGTDAIRRAWDEYCAGTRSRTGVMVHRVPDEQIDAGPVIVSVEVPFLAAETFDQFSERMHATEHCALVEALRRILVAD